MANKDKPNLPENVSSELISRIAKLAGLLEKRADSEKLATQRIKVGTDGIPVLIEMANHEHAGAAKSSASSRHKHLIGELINKSDQEISLCLDKLINLLKGDDTDEAKTRLMKETVSDKNKPG